MRHQGPGEGQHHRKEECELERGKDHGAAAMVGLIAVRAARGAGGAPAAQAACGGVKHFWPPKPRSSPPPLAVGDSVMMGAIEPLRRAGFEIDVRGCRQMSEGLERAVEPAALEVAARAWWWWRWATTGPCHGRRDPAGLRILGSRARARAWSRRAGRWPPRAASIRAAGRRWPTRVKVLDWAARSAGKAWTWDGLHLTPAGARGFARLLRTRLRVAAARRPGRGRGAPSRMAARVAAPWRLRPRTASASARSPRDDQAGGESRPRWC